MNHGRINCILCHGVIAYYNGDKSRLIDHLIVEHGVNHNLPYIIAGCLMSDDERNVIVQLKGKYDKNIQNGCVELPSLKLESVALNTQYSEDGAKLVKGGSRKSTRKKKDNKSAEFIYE